MLPQVMAQWRVVEGLKVAEWFSKNLVKGESSVDCIEDRDTNQRVRGTDAE